MLAIAPIKDWAPLEWPGVNMAFLLSFFGTIALTLAVIPYGKRRPVGKPVSWGEAMLGAFYAFAVHAPRLRHRARTSGSTTPTATSAGQGQDIIGPGGILQPQADGGWFPFTLQYEAVRDIVVVIIHVIFFGLVIFIFTWWQKRGTAAKPGTEIETSSFGRPLVKKA